MPSPWRTSMLRLLSRADRCYAVSAKTP
jgi:hypothetical protein